MKARRADKRFIPRTREEKALVHFVTTVDLALQELARLGDVAARLFPSTDAGIAREAASREVSEATDAGEALAQTKAAQILSRRKKRTKRTLGGD